MGERLTQGPSGSHENQKALSELLLLSNLTGNEGGMCQDQELARERDQRQQIEVQRALVNSNV